MWDLIVSVPDHCLSFYFETHLSKYVAAYRKSYKVIYLFKSLLDFLGAALF